MVSFFLQKFVGFYTIGVFANKVSYGHDINVNFI